MAITWSVGARVKLKNGPATRTYTVQKIIVIKRHGIIRRNGIHKYLIRDTQNGQAYTVSAETLRKA